MSDAPQGTSGTSGTQTRSGDQLTGSVIVVALVSAAALGALVEG